jgi:hypothetical protein
MLLRGTETKGDGMMGRFAGKIVIVIGAARGIGRILPQAGL